MDFSYKNKLNVLNYLRQSLNHSLINQNQSMTQSFY